MKIELTDDARQDIFLIHQYITYFLHEPNIADRLIQNIFDKIELLEDYPYIGPIYTNYFNRYLTFKNYLIFYQIHKEENKIFVRRVLHKKSKR